MADVSLTLVSQGSTNPATLGDISANGLVVSYIDQAAVGQSDVLYVRNLTDGSRTTVASAPVFVNPLQGSSGIDGGALSADGQYIFYSTGGTNGAISGNFPLTILLIKDLQHPADSPVNATPAFLPHFSPTTGLAISFQGLLPVEISDDGRSVLYGRNFEDLLDDISRDGVFEFASNSVTFTRTQVIEVDDGGILDLGMTPLDFSSDGRFVLFETRNGTLTFVDLQDGISKSVAAGATSNDNCMSANGEYIAYSKTTSGLSQVYVQHRVGDSVSDVLVSTSADGTAGNGGSRVTSISGDGHFVAFISSSSNLVDDDDDGVADLFVKNLQTGEVVRIAPAGTVPDAGGFFDETTFDGELSADGTHIAFTTTENFQLGLGGSDTDGQKDVYVATIEWNSPPTAVADTGTAGENETKSFDVLANDTDPDEGDSKTLVSLGNVAVTSANAQVNGIAAASAFTIDSNQVKFAPGSLFDALALGDTATVVVNYTMEDGQGAQASSTLTLTVNGANDPPVANPDSGAAGENETKSFNVLANDTDVDVGATLSLASLGSVTVTSANAQVNGIAAASAFTIDGNQIKFTPGTLFDHLALGTTATVVANYTMQDDHGAQASSTLTLTVNGANDAPVITSGGGGSNATYELKVNFSAITKLVATDVDSGSSLSFSIVGGVDQNLFTIDGDKLAFKVKPIVPHNGYEVIVKVSDGIDSDQQTITVDVTDSKMDGELPGAGADTFVFHSGFGSNSVKNFDLTEDFLQFDHGMFAADTAAAVLAAATDDHKGNTVISDLAGDRLILTGVTTTDLAAHQSALLFV